MRRRERASNAGAFRPTTEAKIQCVKSHFTVSNMQCLMIRLLLLLLGLLLVGDNGHVDAVDDNGGEENDGEKRHQEERLAQQSDP